jgi:hypothetical protein
MRSDFHIPSAPAASIIYLQKPERTKTRLRLPFATFRLILRLEKTLTQFEKTPILQALQKIDCDNNLDDICNQLNLFDY